MVDVNANLLLFDLVRRSMAQVAVTYVGEKFLEFCRLLEDLTQYDSLDEGFALIPWYEEFFAVQWTVGIHYEPQDR
jgi:hypothetical protein